MRVCFAGTGSIGKRHIKNLAECCQAKSIDLSIDVMRSSNSPLDKELEKHISQSYYSWEEIPYAYDAIFICNPTHLHVRTLQETQHISTKFFVEKPIVNDVETFDLELPKENVYYVACPLRYTKALQKAREIVDTNSVYSARSISSSYLPEWRSGIDYRKTYSAHRDEGGGVSIDLVHEWDYLCHLFGFPNEVSMFSGKVSHLEIDSNDLAIYIAQFDSLYAEVHLDYFGRYPQRLLQLFCHDATYEIDILNSRITRNGSEIDVWTEDGNEKYIREMNMFLDIATCGAKNNPNSILNALKVQSVSQGM